MWFGFLRKNNVKLVSRSRRQWLVAVGRWSILGLIAATVGGLWERNGITPYRETCVDEQGKIGCRQCVYFNDCGHPKALSAKQVITKIKS
jgi:hypothetical protein